MPFAAQRFALPALLTATFAMSAGAQQMQCEVNEGSPRQIATAFFAVNQAQQAQVANRPGDAVRHLQSAVRTLTDKPERINNPLGRSFVLGKALSLWLNQPDVGFVATAGTIGWTGAPEQRVDLVVAVDSLFDEVEKAQPGCVAATAPWRAQRGWLKLVNQAIESFNAEQLDSAVAAATRANQLYAGSPYGFMVLGNVAQRRGQVGQAIEHFRQSVSAAGSDTSYDDAKRSILLAMGNLASEVADTASGATRERMAATATGAFQQIVQEFPNAREAGAARSGLTRVRLIAGDTAGFRASYQDQIANPGKYSYQEVLTAAVAAARANQHADAVKLFEGVLQLNPYNRDALFNIALMHNQLNQFDKMIPFINRLVQLDPNNSDNWQLYAFAYNGMGRAAKDIKARRAANDSTVKYYQRSQELPVNVTFTEWTNTPERSSLAGTVENRGTAPKSYTIAVEFLDKAGTVVGTQSTTVSDVAPKSKSRFTVAISNVPTAVAYRYRPVQ